MASESEPEENLSESARREKIIQQAEQYLSIDRLSYAFNPNPEDLKSLQALDKSIKQLKAQSEKSD